MTASQSYQTMADNKKALCDLFDNKVRCSFTVPFTKPNAIEESDKVLFGIEGELIETSVQATSKSFYMDLKHITSLSPRELTRVD